LDGLLVFEDRDLERKIAFRGLAPATDAVA
jgi:hypothetical protein